MTYLFIKAHFCMQSPLVLLGLDAFKISWRDFVILTRVNSLWQYKRKPFLMPRLSYAVP